MTRRQIITAGGVAIAAGLAGCLGSDSNQTDGAETTTAEPPESLRVGDRALSSAFPVELVDPGADLTDIESHVTGAALVAHVQYHDPREGGSHWHFDPLMVPLGETRRLRARFVYSDYSAVPLGSDSRYQLRVTTPSDANTGILSVTVEEDIVSLTGDTEGTTERIFELWDTTTESVSVATPSLEIVVEEQ